ncbi:MAG: Ig-like domain-containing protein, partial [Betaproteobacteria bacterium]
FTITVTAVNDPPAAQNKPASGQIPVQANMKMIAINAGLLTGVTDADSGVNGCVPTFSVASITSSTGGTVSNVNLAAGTFDFEPAAGFTGTAVVNYTVSDNGCPGIATSATATISLTVNGPVIWFVDAGAPAGGNGTLSQPFQTLTPAAAVDAAGDRIFVFTGTYSAGITLNANEWLIGQGAIGTSFDNYFGLTVPAGTITRPAINGTNPNVNAAIGYASSDKIDGIDMDGAGANLSGSSATSFIVNIGRFRRTGSQAATAITLGGSGNTGTFDFKSVTITGAAGASSNKGASISNLTGHFVVAGTDSALTPNGGTVSGSGGHGMEFISVANGGATSVSLTNMTLTGNGLSQAVAGSAGTCGGDLRTGNNLGCVANLHLQTVNAVTLANVSVTNSGQMGINGNNVTALTLTGSTITGNGNESFEDGLTFQNLLGTSSITNTMIKDNAARQITVSNIANNSNLTLGITGTRTNNAYPVKDTGTTEIGKTVQTNTFTDQSLLFDTVSTASNVNMTLNLTGVVFKNSLPGNAVLINPIAASGTLGGTTNDSSFDTTAGGVIIQAQNGMSGTYNVTNSEFNRVNLQSILHAGANPYNAALSGTVSGNIVGTAGQSGSACEPLGGNCNGIQVNMIGGTGSISTKIQNNIVQEFGGIGILLTANGSASPDVNANILGNTVQNPSGLVAHGIQTNMGTTAGANIDGCINMTGNTVSGTFEDPGVGTQFGIVTNVRFLSFHRLPGYGGSPTAVGGPGNAVTDFIIANNTTAGKVFTQAGGSGTYPGGAACATP